MDDRPIDPFNPYARRYAPQQWPQQDPGLDDTQDIPVTPAVRADDTQEVPVVPAQATPPPLVETTPPPVEVTPPSRSTPPAAAVPPPPVAAAPPPPAEPGPPQWPTGVPEPTTAVPVTAAATPPFGPDLTVPPEVVPPRPGGRPIRKPLIAASAGVAVLVALVAVVIFVMSPGSGHDVADRAAESSPAPETTSQPASPTGEQSTSPSHNPEPEPKDSGRPESTDDTDADDDPAGDRQLSVPSRPTKFGAWYASAGTYKGKWEPPADDGGADILGYVVGDCNGNNLAFLDSNTFNVTVQADYLACMSVYAVNNQGMGHDAQHQITNNP